MQFFAKLLLTISGLCQVLISNDHSFDLSNLLVQGLYVSTRLPFTDSKLIHFFSKNSITGQ